MSSASSSSVRLSTDSISTVWVGDSDAVERLKISEQPFIVLLKCKAVLPNKPIQETGIQKFMQSLVPTTSTSPESVVFGAYCSTKAKVQDQYFGDDGSFLFSILPHCNSFRFMDNSSHSNFAYLGKDTLPGLGFGGITPQQSRLWIDRDIANNSIVRDVTDLTYENGNLVPPSMKDKPLNVEALEIWVVTDDSRRMQLARLINE